MAMAALPAAAAEALGACLEVPCTPGPIPCPALSVLPADLAAFCANYAVMAAIIRPDDHRRNITSSLNMRSIDNPVLDPSYQLSLS
jgi:hypothetical protein